MRAIIDSGPLIVLGKLNILYLLENLFEKILIPNIVYKEVITEGKRKGKKDAYIIQDFINSVPDFIEIKKTYNKPGNKRKLFELYDDRNVRK